ncbi:MAG: pentapeptide repeat-containing protein [Planctomycetes bacterium]|nr:pentapeptide repeat-containing protein [Planctomycetota bacterium]
MRLIAGLFFAFFACGAHADIYQWHDGDGDGSLWLSDSNAQPHSNISRQVLWWANLENANLVSANLSASNLSYANLHHANLDNADLAFTLFVGADLRATNFNNANLFYADISNANLTGMENWQTAFWLAARYDENTLFPDGMNPDSFGMINLSVPSPSALAIFGISTVIVIRRRR